MRNFSEAAKLAVDTLETALKGKLKALNGAFWSRPQGVDLLSY
jgi:hypothetical protein